jgi:pSer/pThr/pTyr-binding forkhead associated (FHA) protein
LDPVAVGLKFGFLAVLYLFLMWTARSALKDLRHTFVEPDDATGMHPAGGIDTKLGPAHLRVQTAPGFADGAVYDVTRGAMMGRGDQCEIKLEDNFASTQHARLVAQGDSVVLEDLGSTNGTYLNGQALTGPQPLHDGDRIRIGDSEFSFER